MGFQEIILREDTDISETNGNSCSWLLFIVFLSCKDSLEIYFCLHQLFSCSSVFQLSVLVALMNTEIYSYIQGSSIC